MILLMILLIIILFFIRNYDPPRLIPVGSALILK